MTIDEAISYLEEHIDHAGWRGRSSRAEPGDLSLGRMRSLMAALDNPQRQLRVVHISGTNGKGSTATMTAELLAAHGRRVGLFTSPHISRYNERIRIDGKPIADGDLAALLAEIRAAEHEIGERLAPFEILTAAMLLWFDRQQVDVAVIEVGVLGRYDATNVCTAEVAVITNIGRDHTTGVGDWQWRIAQEKSGIIKPNAMLITGVDDHRFDPLFVAEGPRAIWRLGEEITVSVERADGGFAVATPLQHLAHLRLALRGQHQQRNAALAVAAVGAFLGHALGARQVSQALAMLAMPARVEIAGHQPLILIDGAHNPDAALALRHTLDTEFAPRGRRILVLGVLAGRDPAAMLEALEFGNGDSRLAMIITCSPNSSRALDARTLSEALDTGAKRVVAADLETAIALARSVAEADDQIVITGSMYLAAQARELLCQA